MSEPKPKIIQEVVSAPVVSDDSNSQESILARQARTIQVQAAADSVYDTIVERFSDSQRSDRFPRISPILFLASFIGAGVLFLVVSTRLGLGKKGSSR
jgi:hypothetical protein